MPGRTGSAPRAAPADARSIGRHTTRPSLDEDGRLSAALVVDPMTADQVGSERVRRHPHRRARSAPPCGVSRGPRAYRVRVPIRIDRYRQCGERTVSRRPRPKSSYSAVFDPIDAVSAILPWRQRASTVMQGRERQSDARDRILRPLK